ncbi:zinc-binding alcohol dehydrogenase family protein [Horticoccus sp. 23ND18S-11]|uniref:zinc-binding alcohol dehydrogenase family protein n=1 Tax=Horticoccus sp. 23ND18S-11 TaxID=3391832 RepID=UPI0039C93BED
MKAIQLEKPQSFRALTVAEPAAPGPGEALVRIHRIGICGTDYGGYLGKMPFYSYPRIPGHELGVEVLAVGPDVTNVRAGDRCSVEPYINCQRCYSCRRGLTNCCESHQTLGVMCDGGMCERMLLPARKLHVSRTLSMEQLALVETLAIGCHAVDRGDLKAGEHALIIGAGPIGLSAIEFVKVAGARCIVMDVNEARLQFCRERMGVDHTIAARGDGRELEALQALTGGQLADVVIDATGSNKSMSHALNYCTFGGRLVYVGITQQEVSFPHAPIMHRRELSIRASRNALSRDFARIIELIETGRINTDPWITHRARFDDMIAQFPAWLKPESGVIKAMVAME